jgi:hypothetical protein
MDPATILMLRLSLALLLLLPLVLLLLFILWGAYWIRGRQWPRVKR